jgi:hypothetical protein
MRADTLCIPPWSPVMVFRIPETGATTYVKRITVEWFLSYINITTVDLENNFKQMRHPWDPQKPAESLFKKIQDCDDYSEAGGVLIGHPQQINLGYAKIFATGNFMSACRRWNEKPFVKKIWHNSKLTSLLHTASISKCMVNLQPRQVTTHQTPM